MSNRVFPYREYIPRIYTTEEGEFWDNQPRNGNIVLIQWVLFVLFRSCSVYEFEWIDISNGWSASGFHFSKLHIYTHSYTYKFQIMHLCIMYACICVCLLDVESNIKYYMRLCILIRHLCHKSSASWQFKPLQTFLSLYGVKEFFPLL